MPTHRNLHSILATIAFVGAIVFHFTIFTSYNIKWTDSDQTVMWTASEDMANGHFHEPRFYGQDYGNMAEALLAAPLVALGGEPYQVVPLITHLMVLSIIFNLFYFFWKEGKREWAISIVALSVTLAYYIDIQMSLPRAYIPGIALSSFSIYFHQRKSALAFLTLGLLSILSLSLNVSAVFLLAPILLHQFFQSEVKKTFLIYFSVGAMIGVLIHLGIQHFYTLHPEIIVHSFEFRLSTYDFGESIKKLHETFRGFIPLIHTRGLGFLVLLSIVILYNFIRKNTQTALIGLSVLIILLFSLNSNKAHDGFESVYFSTSRMYLALPFTLLLVLGFSFKKVPILVPILLIPISGISAWSKINTGYEDFHLFGYRMVQVRSVEQLQEECESLYQACEQHHTELIIFGTDGPDILNYGCGVLNDPSLISVRLGKERRSWIWEETSTTKHSNILFYGGLDDDLLEEEIEVLQIGERQFILSGPSHSPSEWASILGWPVDKT
ncbi:MAG: hypothetical protein EP346_06010 [Bacteroidetes bacterium]|nr:MAG: hypothetical protein EP346_06010 [Bacteroidota bacterium]